MIKRAQGYRVFLVNTLGYKMKLEDVPVINEYPDIFPNEVASLPPKREIKSKMAFGTTPISKTPYQMAPAERN